MTDRLTKAIVDLRNQGQPIVPAKALTFGNPGDSVTVQLPGSTSTKTVLAGSPINSSNVVVAGGYAFCDTAPRVVGTETKRFLHKKPEKLAPDKKANIKYLYSLYSDGLWRFYVGGWQKDSVLAYTTPEGVDQLFHASVDNLGSSTYSLNIAYLKGGNRVYRKILSTGTGWEYSTSGSGAGLAANSFGHGFWRIAGTSTLTTVSETSETTSTSEVITTHETITQVASGYQRYLWNGAIIEATGTTGSFFEDRMLYDYITSGFDCSIINSDTTLTTEWIAIPSTQFKENTTDFQIGFVGDTCGGSSTPGDVQFQYFTIFKTNKSGTVTAAIYEESRNTSEITTYGAWYSADTRTLTPEPLTFEYFNYYLDVQNASGFSAIPISEVQYINATDGQDKNVNVSFYNSGFSRQSKSEKIRLYKPSVSGGTFTWHGASYHA